MIDALLGGTLAKDPEARTTKTGNAYALATLRVPAGGDTVLFARVMAFDAHVRDELLALAKGDAVSVSGPLELGVWKANDGETRPSVSVVAHAVVSPYHVKRKRSEVQNAQQGAAQRRAERANGSRTTSSRSAAPVPDDDLNDAF
ncbi:single-stranded DNA-binding protein [Paraburkholderia adhaesiva]|uniref:single-stranded DNA-binding protein n=1 Tax=Paraburkholderia adhaesiva TaxID=2883244 RepID=UPI001F3FE8E9|nr:single-stranded DNA-binding protein [Paraburkholderia adhaesiva]